MKTIMLLGFNKSNRHLYNYLKDKKVHLLIYDDNPQDDDFDYWSLPRLKKEMPYIDLTIRSPGITIKSEIYQLIAILSKEIMSEIDYAYLKMKKYHPHFIVVSGTNGKTTAVHFLKQALSTSFKNVFLAGNVGIPLSYYLDKIQENDFIILELSSYQLENTRYLKADYAYLTNISPNHLDGVYNYLTYIASKKRLRYLVTKKNLFFYNALLCDQYLIGTDIYSFAKKHHLTLQKDRFRGEHNYRHALFSLIIVYLYQGNISLAKQALYHFVYLPYRLEVKKYHFKLTIVNDSKSTTVSATNQCLATFNDKKRIIIMGGHHKSEKLELLNIQSDDDLYVYGEAKEAIAKVFPKAHVYDDLAEIVFVLKKYKDQPWYLLFSPGCSSFDQFQDYIARGQYFDQLIRDNHYE